MSKGVMTAACDNLLLARPQVLFGLIKSCPDSFTFKECVVEELSEESAGLIFHRGRFIDSDNNSFLKLFLNNLSDLLGMACTDKYELNISLIEINY
jgi:hypothetical protein